MGDWLRGAIDLHVHSGPDAIGRYGSAIRIAREAAAAGMRGIVFKDHLGASLVKAGLVREVVPGFEAFGGITLNSSSGGLHLVAVEWAASAGAKVVMLPTFDSTFNVYQLPPSFHNRQLGFGKRRTVVRVLGEDGTLDPTLEAILQVVVSRDLVLSNGHLGPDETIAVVRRARELGVRAMVIEHPNSYYPDFWTLDLLKEVVSLGARLNLSMGAYHPLYGRRKDVREAADIVRAVGAEHCNLISDYGQEESPAPHEGLRSFCEMLVRCGLGEPEVRRMVADNPAWLLGLPS